MVQKIKKRFTLIERFCKGEVLHLGGGEPERGISLNNVLKKKHKVWNADIQPGADYLRDLNSKSWRINRAFDTVIAPEIIEHVGDPINFIHNCFQLTKKGGLCVVTTPNASSLIYLYNPRWCVTDPGWGLVHIHAFTKPMIEEIMKAAGFKIVYSIYLNEFLYNPLGYIICSIFPRLRGDIFIVGRKL